MNSTLSIIEFSNRESKLTFGYAVNLDKKGQKSSLTFYYKLTNSFKVDFENSEFDTCINFIDIIQGKIYGSLMVEKYKNSNGSKTYLMHDGSNYKIGQSINPQKRLLELKTGNPTIELINHSCFIAERYFHELFMDCKVGGEWFNLNHIDYNIANILIKSSDKLRAEMLMRFYYKKVKSNNVHKQKEKIRVEKVIRDNKFLIYKIPFGKYKSKKLKDMSDDLEIAYLRWAYRSLTGCDDFKSNIYLYLKFRGLSI